ncbi:flavin reductase family protein [Paraburkholderia panacisoli]|uniref:Flavin reductase family protein n=1 Tax=Paraburkholderia panacisoli TaxID=2603818 RepID=A0A5B0FXZ0_9BURK|nr:flavin reductase family protein [Paraburkholderia panacisoli]KAA0996146.1 flavin reductase family protein [Paraburkholderia panacisoli]
MPTIITKDNPPLDTYFLLTSLVVPRPIAWVSSISASGVRNLAPYSHFNNCSTIPPIMHFTSNGVKDSVRNIKETGEFVINVVSHNFRKQMRITSAEWPTGVDEFEKAGLESVPSDFIRPERVKGARASIECKLRDIIQMGDGYMVFGDVVCFHIDDDVWVNGRVDISRLQPVGKLDGLNYSTITEVERLELPVDIARMTKDYGGTR